MKKKIDSIEDYPTVVEWIDRQSIAFNSLFERCFQKCFREGRAEEVAEYAKQAIIKSYKK